MADLVIVPANVGAASSTTRTSLVQVGEAVTQGQPGYLDPATRKHLQSDSDAVGASGVDGVFLTAAAADGYALIGSGEIAFGAILTEGTVYVLSDTKGGIKPIADQVTGEMVTIIGVATSSSVMEVKPVVTTAVVP